MATKKKRTPLSQNDRWVAIAADSAIETRKDDVDSTFVRLRNPSTGAASLYLLGSEDVQLYEVKAFSEDCHSWFIGQTVQRDGRLLYVTPMDPLYLLLPYLVKAVKEGKFQPMNQMVMDEDFPACTRLLNCTRSLASVHHIAEEKEVGGLQFYRYSLEKTLDWLKKKVDRTVKALRNANISVGDGVKSASYVRVKLESEARDEDYLRYAHGLLSAYVSGDLSGALLAHLRLPELVTPEKEEPPSKPPKKMSAAQKSLAKVDKSGMKTMSAFFSPKAKLEKN
ncbi:ribonuclease H2 subunit B isoform X2 [Osmerus eperlanus]|uniref:ribonuclease H2 subunit B isoform X2 n=1 Tax=Osmerus eperlanus TaxID=29151 RepID=UPI002E167545